MDPPIPELEEKAASQVQSVGAPAPKKEEIVQNSNQLQDEMDSHDESPSAASGSKNDDQDSVQPTLF